MHRSLVILAVATALAACKPADPAPAAQTTAPEAAPAPAVIAAEPMGETPATAASFDAKGFAGTFTGGDTTLDLRPDGTYMVADGGATMDGTWTAEAGDTRLRLDPNTKAQEDRLFAITGHDRLDAIDADGKPAAHPITLNRRPR